MSSNYTLHPQARDGFSSEHTEHYNAARPDYPVQAYSYLRQGIGLTKTRLNVVEIGSGTGIFTRGLLSHPDFSGDTIAVVKAIEPSEGMRRVFAETVHDARVSVSNGTFDDIPTVPDGWADLIAIATAFHWCLDFDAAIREFCRVLKPGGLVFLVWNLVTGDRIAWTQQLRAIPAKYDPKNNHENTAFRGVFKSPLYDACFEKAEENEIHHFIPTTEQGVISRVLSWSAIAPLDEQEKEKIKAEVTKIIAKGDGLVWVDEDKNLLQFPHDCLAVTIRRKESK